MGIIGSSSESCYGIYPSREVIDAFLYGHMLLHMVIKKGTEVPIAS